MSRATIEYMNARRAAKAASGGAKQNHRVEYAPDYEPDGFELAMSRINNFALWAEASRCAYLKAIGLEPEAEQFDAIPF